MGDARRDGVHDVVYEDTIPALPPRAEIRVARPRDLAETRIRTSMKAAWQALASRADIVI